MKVFGTIAMLGLALCASAAELYKNDFQAAEPGGVPDDFLVLDGAFAVKEEGGNKFLELPGAPLDTFGVLFGPSVKEDADATVTARIFGSAKGRRYPTFEVGLHGVGGYRLRVSPGKKQLELLRNDVVKHAVPLEWVPGKWTFLKLSVKKQSDKWNLDGRVWQEGAQEPKEATLTFSDSEAPPPGRASVFGMPYSGNPIRFDDLLVSGK